MSPAWQQSLLIPETPSTDVTEPPSPCPIIEESTDNSQLFNNYHNHNHLHLPINRSSTYYNKNYNHEFSEFVNVNKNNYQESHDGPIIRKLEVLSRIRGIFKRHQPSSSHRHNHHNPHNPTTPTSKNPSSDLSDPNQFRYFLKSGVYNTKQINVFEKTRRYIKDIFTTLVDTRWRWTLFVFSICYLMSWLGFALLYYTILHFHGDLSSNTPSESPCIVGVQTFPAVFLFSLETQHTIGYGTRFINDHCPDAILVLVIQSIAGILIEAFLVGVVFAKLSRPKKRAGTLIFSKNAVVCMRDGELVLMVRVGDIRSRSGILEAHVRAQVVRKRVTAEGEVINNYQEEIKVGGCGEDSDRILLFWPTLIVHPIDSSSPFYQMTAQSLLNSNFELIVVLEGVVESTGMSTQLRTSYLPHEILWGQRFKEIGSYKNQEGRVVFDFRLFHCTEGVGEMGEGEGTMSGVRKRLCGNQITISVDHGDEDCSASYSTGTASFVNHEHNNRSGNGNHIDQDSNNQNQTNYPNQEDILHITKFSRNAGSDGDESEIDNDDNEVFHSEV